MQSIFQRKSASISTSELSLAITQDQWEQVIRLCSERPDSAKVWTNRQGLFEGIKDSNVLPLHEALVANAPADVISALINAYSEGVCAKESSYQRLPLHCACRKNANLQVVDTLLRSFSQAALEPDSLGRLPIHYALSNGADDKVVTALLKAQPDCARGFDKKGWTPLHVACGVGASTPVIKKILNCYPEAAIMRTQKGSTAFQCLNLTKAPNKKEVGTMLKKVAKKVDAQLFRQAQKPDSERILV